jgi:hypothetical protein
VGYHGGMGLRDRLKKLVRPAPEPVRAEPKRIVAAAAPVAWPAPQSVGVEALAGAVVVELTAVPRFAGAVRPDRAALGTMRPAGRVVVVADDPAEAAGVAEVLTARLGRSVGWVAA